MFVECHCIVWNEAETIHLTIKHYQQFCDRIILYDNFSTDNTREIAEALGCEIRPFGIAGVLDDREYTKLKNNCWKGSDADWVIIVDADEILWHDDMIGRLNFYKRNLIDMIITYGWQVFSKDVPRETWLEQTKGFHDQNYSKFCIFNPKRVKEINYVHGCHVCKPIENGPRPLTIYGEVNLITLFHYRNVGGPERLVKRHALYRERMSEWNKRWNAGVHYTYEDSKRRKEWQEQFDKSVEYYSPGIV